MTYSIDGHQEHADLSVISNQIALKVEEVTESKTIMLTVRYKDSKMVEWKEEIIEIDITYEGAGGGSSGSSTSSSSSASDDTDAEASGSENTDVDNEDDGYELETPAESAPEDVQVTISQNVNSASGSIIVQKTYYQELASQTKTLADSKSNPQSPGASAASDVDSSKQEDEEVAKELEQVFK